MQQYIPGAESPENMQMAQAANDEFMKVLEQDPKNKVAIASLASLYFNQKKLDEAQAVVREADRRRSAEQGSLLQPGRHRLVASGIRSTARPAPSWA